MTMSLTKTNTASELPGHDIIPMYTWEERRLFADLVRSLGGSSDTHGADLCATDRPGHHGRYPRQYTSSGLAADGSALPFDIAGQTMSFLASTMQRSAGVPRGVVALIGAPWATQAERDATYAWLASEAHVRCNDATTAERALAVTAPTARPIIGRKYLVITRHNALVQHLREQGHIGEDATVLDHATEDDVLGQHVIGVLPIRLAEMCETYSECSLVLELQDRGVSDLPIERIREIAQPLTTYRIERVPLAKGVENLAGDLELEREAHRLTVLELTSCREAGEKLHDELANRDLDRSEAVIVADTATAEISDLKRRLFGMTRAAARITTGPALDSDDVRILGKLRDLLQPSLHQESREILGRLVLVDACAKAIDARVYTPTGDGSCLGCGRPEGEHARGAWSLACPPDVVAARRCGTDSAVRTPVEVVVDADPATTSIMDWIVEAVSIDRAHATYSPLVALADLIAAWVDATKAVQALESRPPGPRRDGLSAALARRNTVESMLIKAGAR